MKMLLILLLAGILSISPELFALITTVIYIVLRQKQHDDLTDKQSYQAIANLNTDKIIIKQVGN
jgi:hypothetical protein